MRAVMQGGYWLDREHIGSMIAAMRTESRPAPVRRPANRFNLTSRELQVITAVKAAESNREIATRLSVREDTVKHHLSNIFDKLGVFSRVELAVFAINHGLDAGESPSNGPRISLLSPLPPFSSPSPFPPARRPWPCDRG